MKLNRVPYIESSLFSDRLFFRSKTAEESDPDSYALWVAEDPKIKWYKFIPDDIKANETIAITKGWQAQYAFIDGVAGFNIRGQSSNSFFRGAYQANSTLNISDIYIRLRMTVLSHNDPTHTTNVPPTDINDPTYLAKYNEILDFLFSSDDKLTPEIGDDLTGVHVAPTDRVDYMNETLGDFPISDQACLIRDWAGSDAFIKDARNYTVNGRATNKVFTGKYIIHRISRVAHSSADSHPHLVVYLRGV